MTHWHDTPEFDRIRDQRVAALKATDTDEAANVCRHGGLEYLMTDRRGETWFLCRKCCECNVEIELFRLDALPVEAA